MEPVLSYLTERIVRERVFESESATMLTIFVTWRKTVNKSRLIASKERLRPSAATMSIPPFGMWFDLSPDWELA